jgi:hypothetical protein
MSLIAYRLLGLFIVELNPHLAVPLLSSSRLLTKNLTICTFSQCTFVGLVYPGVSFLSVRKMAAVIILLKLILG